MQEVQKLSELVNEIDATLYNRFSGRTFLIRAEITDVKKQPDKKWCFLKFIEKDGNLITTEMKGVFWSNTYYHIENFEKETQQKFISGIEITCGVRVRFHKRYGIDVEVLSIDYAYAVGKLELERKRVLERLVNENSTIQLLYDETFSTLNKRIVLPMVIQKIALITAPGSDGQRDFNTVMNNNKYEYAFAVTSFLTTIQGDKASEFILQQLQLIMQSKQIFDVVVICRGGGSDIDFKSFNDYELAKNVATFPIPILTGIGHDRNTSITDLIARQLRTPTEVATFIIDNNMSFESDVQILKDRFYRRVNDVINIAKYELVNYSQRIKNLHPDTILKKGFAIIMSDNKIITDPTLIVLQSKLAIILKDQKIEAAVIKKMKNENSTNI